MKKDVAIIFIQSILSSITVCWLFVEAHNALETAHPWEITFWILILIGAIIGVAWFFINGFSVQGFLKSHIVIKSNAIQSEINIYFGDIFKSKGCIAVGVNDFFDSLVDDSHISSNSLHGKMLKKFWSANTIEWDRKVAQQLESVTEVENVERNSNAKNNRYDIGTSVYVTSNNHKFICTALSKTNIESLECSVTLTEFSLAIRELLKKARSVCSGHPLNLPLLGSGLSRSGIKENIIINIILLAIFELSKEKKITDTINIILPENKKKDISLKNIMEDWQ